MQAFIYVCEDCYEGLHGMFEQRVAEVDSYEEALAIGYELGEQLYDSYEEFDNWDEEEREERLIIEIWKVKENDLPLQTLDNLAYAMGEMDFTFDYCEEWEDE